MKMSDLSNLAIVFGQGGHENQALKFLDLIENHDRFSKSTNIVKLAERGCSNNYSNTIIEIIPIRKKEDSLVSAFFYFPLRLLINFFTAYKIYRVYKFKALISFGPGIVLPYAILYKFLGVRIIHIETRCRFDTKSLSGFFMYKISDKFYVQNLDLIHLYPNAIYSGRL